MSHRHISLSGSEDEAYEEAARLAVEDMDEDDPSPGEIIEHLANAYRGYL